MELWDSADPTRNSLGIQVFNRIHEKCKICRGLGHHHGKCPLLLSVTLANKTCKISRKVWGDVKKQHKVNGKQKCIQRTAEHFKAKYVRKAKRNFVKVESSDSSEDEFTGISSDTDSDGNQGRPGRGNWGGGGHGRGGRGGRGGPGGRGGGGPRPPHPSDESYARPAEHMHNLTNPDFNMESHDGAKPAKIKKRKPSGSRKDKSTGRQSKDRHRD